MEIKIMAAGVATNHQYANCYERSAADEQSPLHGTNFSV
jgi:hypothetical protein